MAWTIMPRLPSILRTPEAKPWSSRSVAPNQPQPACWGAFRVKLYVMILHWLAQVQATCSRLHHVSCQNVKSPLPPQASRRSPNISHVESSVPPHHALEYLSQLGGRMASDVRIFLVGGLCPYHVGCFARSLDVFREGPSYNLNDFIGSPARFKPHGSWKKKWE